MKVEPVHSYFGTPLSDWIEAVPNELDIDAVGLWQIIPNLQKAFGLKDTALDHAIRETLAGLLARGARPVVGSSAQDGSWEEVGAYGDSPAEIIDSVVAEWHTIGRDPDVGDLWFALPRCFAQVKYNAHLGASELQAASPGS